jgi:hypothetical protein
MSATRISSASGARRKSTSTPGKRATTAKSVVNAKQVSISPTLNAKILRTNVLLYVHQSQNVTRKAAKKDFRTKNLRV